VKADYNPGVENRINKPKVFLSHAWENKPFIERLAVDLRRCSIEPWLDTEEIRDGRSWLKMIFEDGIPTCDAVIVYFTEDSLRSKMVERELDATVVHQLSEQGVTLLPYISRADLRDQLRSDIQTLQCREWNDGNYEGILPTVVAEIWRSYLERTIDAAVLQEKSRRLEQELENRRLKEQYESSVFSPNEEQEFQYLFKKLSKKIAVTFGLFKKKDGDNARTKFGEEICQISILRILLATINEGGIYFDRHYVGYHLANVLGETVSVQGHEVIRDGMGEPIDPRVAANIKTELNTYGLTRLTKVERFNRWEVAYEIADKMYRFKYWMEYNNFSADETLEHVITLTPEKPSPSNQEETRGGQATAQALAADKRISQARRRKTWSASGEGAIAASKEVQAIFTDLEQRVTKSNEVLENIKLDFHSDLNSCSVTTADISMLLKWNCPTNNTRDCLLFVSVSGLNSETNPASQSLPRQVFACEFGLDVDNDLQVLWSRKDSSHRDSYSLTKIADLCWSTLIGSIQRNEEGTL
jgi:hypothetical protein